MEKAMKGAQNGSSFPFSSWDLGFHGISPVVFMRVNLPSAATFCLLWPLSHTRTPYIELRIFFQPQEFE